MSRDREYIKLINSTRWIKLRKALLSRWPLCERCQELGLVTSATEVHHREPVERGRTFEEKRQLAYAVTNLQPLCHACHKQVHREMKVYTKDQAKERKEKTFQKFVSKYLEN